MHNSIQLYSNEEFSVRTTRDDNGTVWFVAKDIMRCLEYSDTSTPAQVMQSVPEQWKGIKRIDTVERGMQDMLCLAEQGVYFFLGRSDKPKALPYQMWIAGDVVPSIMHTGGYLTSSQQQVSLKENIEVTRAILEIKHIEGNQLVLALDKIYQRYTGFSMLEATGTQLEAPTQHQLLTPTDIGKHFGVSARRVNELLAGAGFQYKIGDKWEALELGAPYAVVQDTNKRYSDGTPVRQLKWDVGILPIIEQLLDVPA